MALSGYIPNSSGSSYGTGYVYFIRWSASQNKTNKTATITAKWIMKKVAKDPYGSYNNYPNQACVAISIAGTGSGNIYRTFDLRNSAIGTELELGSYTKTVNYNSDGTLSVNINGSHYTGIAWGTKTTSGTITLDKISVASVPSVSGTLELGNTITINTNRQDSNFTHNIYVTWGSQINNQRILTGIGASSTWTIPKSYANYIPNGTSGVLYITCETYKGNLKIGDKTISVTVSVPNTAEFSPNISDITLWENSQSGVPQTWGVWVQNKSKLSYDVVATGAYSSTIKSYQVVVNGVTYYSKSYTTDVLLLKGTNTIVATVTDSRGRTKTYSKTFTVLEYNGPTIESFKVNRCLQNGTLDEEGEYAKVEINATVPKLNNKNTYSYYLKYKKSEETEYTVKEFTIDETSDTKNFILTKSIVMAMDGNYAFDFMFMLADAFNGINKITDIGTAFALINFNASGKGLALGKVSKKDALEVNMDIYDKFDQLIPNGLAEYRTGGTDIDPNTTLKHLILTETNTPNNDGFYYIITLFYASKATNQNKTQIAIPYIYSLSQNKRNIFIRQNVGGSWNSWTQI